VVKQSEGVARVRCESNEGALVEEGKRGNIIERQGERFAVIKNEE